MRVQPLQPGIAGNGIGRDWQWEFFLFGKSGDGGEIGHLPSNDGTLWQAGGKLGDAGLGLLDGFERVLTETGNDDSANGFGAVFVERSTTHGRAELNAGKITDGDGSAVAHGDDRTAEVIEGANITGGADDVLDAVDSEIARAGFGVGAAHGLRHIHEHDVVGAEGVWIDVDLIFTNEAADGADFGDGTAREQCVTNLPVLDGAQLVEIPATHGLPLGVAPLKRVPKHLTETGGVRA